MVIDTLYTYASISNGPAGYFSAYAIKGEEEFENFNVADFYGAGGLGMRFINHDSLEFFASSGSLARAIINEGYLVLHNITVDTLLNEGFINSATITIGNYYSGAGEWFVQPSGQNIIVDTISTMIITAPGRLNVSDGDLTVYGVLDGSGCVSVQGATVNHGLITGTLDICDLSPTTTLPPIVDLNTGTITAGVMFCSNNGCFVGIGPENHAPQFHLFPNPASDRIELQGLRDATVEIRIFDLQGREWMAPLHVTESQRLIDVTQLATGCYTLRIGSGTNSMAMPLVIAR
ncbi:MAG: T9SS type A sorting domain-containing protein [Flavobacteriales bacterium]|nr:T9SS type A sorting domain-containing protein [Flavobacteriales bacterium]